MLNPADPGRFTLTMAPQGAVSLRADCNRCSGSYSLSGSSLAVGTIACTRAFCSSAPFDTEYTSAVQTATRLELREDSLTVYSPDGTLRFRKE